MIKIFFVAALSAVMMINCQSTGSSVVSTATQSSIDADGCSASETSHAEDAGIYVSHGVFSDVTGKEWKLSEISLTNSIIFLDRDKLTQDGIGDSFTLKFDADMVSGKGEPNRYSAPYTRDNQKISIMPMRSTLMASIFPNEILNEHEFFSYLQNVHEWKLAGNNLELLSKAADGRDARLVWTASE